MLVPPESSSAVLVMIRSKSVYLQPFSCWILSTVVEITNFDWGTKIWRSRAVKTRSVYLTWAWIGTRSWQTDRQTDRQNDDSQYALSTTCAVSRKADVRRSIKLANFLGVVSLPKTIGRWNRWTMTHVTCHVTIVTSKNWQTIRTPTLLCCFIFCLRNNIKSGRYGSAVGYSTGK